MNDALEHCYEGYLARKADEVSEVNYLIVKAMAGLMVSEKGIDVNSINSVEELVDNICKAFRNLKQASKDTDIDLDI